MIKIINILCGMAFIGVVGSVCPVKASDNPVHALAFEGKEEWDLKKSPVYSQTFPVMWDDEEKTISGTLSYDQKKKEFEIRVGGGRNAMCVMPSGERDITKAQTRFSFGDTLDSLDKVSVDIYYKGQNIAEDDPLKVEIDAGNVKLKEKKSASEPAKNIPNPSNAPKDDTGANNAVND